MNTNEHQENTLEAVGFVASSLGMTMYDNMVKDDPYLTKHDVEVYGCLCRFADIRTNSTYISVEPTMCDYTGIGRTTIMASLKNLEEAGYITKQIRTTANGGRLPSIYTVVSLEGKEPRYPISESKFYRNHKQSLALAQQDKRERSTKNATKLSDSFKEALEEVKNNVDNNGAESTRDVRGYEAESTRSKRGYEAESTRSKRGEGAESTRSKRGDVEPKVHAAYSNNTKTLKTLNNFKKIKKINKKNKKESLSNTPPTPNLGSNTQTSLFDMPSADAQVQPTHRLDELKKKTAKARSQEMIQMYRQGLITPDDFTMQDIGYYYAHVYNEVIQPKFKKGLVAPTNKSPEHLAELAHMRGADNNTKLMLLLDEIVTQFQKRMNAPLETPLKRKMEFFENRLAIGCLNRKDIIDLVLEFSHLTFKPNKYARAEARNKPAQPEQFKVPEGYDPNRVF